MDRILRKYLKKIKPLKSRIREIWLFGSRARGDHETYSDYDLLIVVDKRTRKISDVVFGAAADLLLDDLVDISPKIFTWPMYEYLMKLKTPFITNVHREGIRLA